MSTAEDLGMEGSQAAAFDNFVQQGGAIKMIFPYAKWEGLQAVAQELRKEVLEEQDLDEARALGPSQLNTGWVAPIRHRSASSPFCSIFQFSRQGPPSDIPGRGVDGSWCGTANVRAPQPLSLPAGPGCSKLGTAQAAWSG